MYPRKTDSYYFDLYHMVGSGADIFSTCFSKFFNAYLAGEDTSGWFYKDNAEYLASISYITNCWISTYVPGEWNRAWEQDEAVVAAAAQGRDVYLANCNHGTSVTPEYRFVLLDEATGAETELTGWQTDGIYSCEPGAMRGKCLRVYARPQGGEQNRDVYFDFRPGKDEEPCLQV